ncbi:family 43 glycosylhydrolase [Sorangium sp. So ce302]|uniref:family 43 glycosylhydrolase n=1 Tax=Sorangium sp. So ce302 TaxID=3133297 RepID=UPI003F644232
MRRRWLLALTAAVPSLASWRTRSADAEEPDESRAGDPAAARGRALGVHAGEFVHVYDPSVGESEPWYINDHCFVRDDAGTWHMFGITHAEPAAPLDEHIFAHATAPDLLGPWTKQPPALTLDRSYYGETHLWAPHVVHHDGLYWMFYCGGGNDHTQYAISVATSPDLWTWTRHPGGPLFRDGYDARDPMVLRLGGHWIMYYTATSDPAGGNHVVAYRTSADLVHWSERGIAYTDPVEGTWGGGTESPFVLPRFGLWYLFIGPRGGYVGTDVFVSLNPRHFETGWTAGHVASHAAEVIEAEGSWWVSSAGWGRGGVYIAPLEWK